MRYGNKLKEWFFDDEEPEYDEMEEEVEEEVVLETVKSEPEKNKSQIKTSMFEKPKSTKTSDAVKALNANKDGHLVLFEPRAYRESQEIANYLKQKKAAVVNLHRLNRDLCKRVIDFLSGVIYAIDGDIQQIGPSIFLCTPKNIGVTGNITLDAFSNEE